MRIRSDSPSAKSRWKSISPSSAVAASGASATTASRAGEQSGADTDQQLDQQRFLVGEVPVDRGPADACGGADVLQAHREKAALGDQSFRGGDQLVAAVGLRLAAAGSDGGEAIRKPGETTVLPPSALVDISVNRH